MVFALLLLFAGCERAELAKELVNLAAVDSSACEHKISRNEALSALGEMLRSVDCNKTRGGSINRLAGICAEDLCAVGGVKSHGGAPEAPLLYYLNLSGGNGYAILPADRRLGELPLVVTEQGCITAEHFATREENVLQPFDVLSMPAGGTIDSGYVMDNTDRDINLDVAQLVLRYANTVLGRTLGKVEGGVNDEECEVYYSYGPWEWGQKVGPHLSTKWHQDTPFNNWCPIKTNSDGKSRRAPAGCVTIAVAQILAYHGKPDGKKWWGVPVNWDTVRTVCNNANKKYRGSEEAQRQAAALAREIGNWLNVRYRYDGSSTGDFMARWYLKHLGYSRVDRHCGVDEPLVARLLDAGRIVYASSTTHAWLIDGYMETKRTYTCTTICGSERTQHSYVEHGHIWVHCNFGWRGRADGYYFPGIFNTITGPELTDAVDGHSIRARTQSGDRNYSKNIHTITYW